MENHTIVHSPSPQSSAPNLASLTLELDSMEKTLAIGKHLSHILKGGDVLALIGDLGAGKTSITQGIVSGLQMKTGQVSSPTFTLIQTYDCRIPVIHVDLYRLEHPLAIQQLGLDDYFTDQHIVIIEWADRLLQILPPDYLEIQLQHGDTETSRHLTILATGPRTTNIVNALHVTATQIITD